MGCATSAYPEAQALNERAPFLLPAQSGSNVRAVPQGAASAGVNCALRRPGADNVGQGDVRYAAVRRAPAAGRAESRFLPNLRGKSGAQRDAYHRGRSGRRSLDACAEGRGSNTFRCSDAARYSTHPVKPSSDTLHALRTLYTLRSLRHLSRSPRLIADRRTGASRFGRSFGERASA